MQIETIDQAAAQPSCAAFTAETVALEAAAAFLAKRLIERRNTIPILSMVRIEASPAGYVALTGCDLDNWATITVAATVTSPGAVCIDAATLAAQLAKVRKAGSGQVDIAHNDQGRATLKAGRTRFNAPAMPVDDFPMPTGELAEAAPLSAFTMPADRFLADLAALAPCISTESTRYYLNGIALQVRDMAGRDRFTMAATDGHNMGIASRPLPAGAELLPDVILARKTVALIDKAAKLAPGAESIAIEFDPAGRGAGMFRLALGPVVIQAKVIDGTFPDWAKAFEGDLLTPTDEADAPLFPELIPGTPLAAMAKLDKANGGLVWTDAASGKLGTVPGDDGLLFGALNLRADNAEPVKGYRYSHDANDAAAVEYLSGQARRRNGTLPGDGTVQLISDGGEYLGATIGGGTWAAGYWEERPNWETLAIERVYVEPVKGWQDGAYSIVMPRERAERRCDVTLEIDGDGAVYPIAVNSGGKIHLSADQVRNIAGESCFGTIALTIAGRAVHIVQWLFDQGDSRFLTVRPDGRCYSGKDAWRAQYLSRDQVEAAMRGEELPEPVEICPTAGAEGESDPMPVGREGLEPVEALSGPEIEPNDISDNSGNTPAAAVTEESRDQPDPFAELAARVAAIEARLAAPLSGESSPAPTVEKAKRTPAHEWAVRRAWAERKAARAARFMIQLRTDQQANAERGKQFYRERMEAERVKRLRSTLIARQRGKQMAIMAGMIAAKANAYSEAELQAAVAVERERAAAVQRDLDLARANHAGVADGAGVAAAQAAAQMERAMQAEAMLESLRADLNRERAALAAVTERNARLLQGMADLAERVERAEAAIAA